MPEKLGNLESLQFLQLSENKLSGELPASIFNLSSAYYFGVVANNFEGMIPTTFVDNLPNLQVLLMGGNQFKGLIPASLSNASKLFFIDMAENNFSGIIPSSLGRLTSLSVLNLNKYYLEANDRSSWGFLDVLTNCSWLKFLSLSYNKLSGMLPNSIANLSTRIQEIHISAKQISGSIPPGIDNLINLTNLVLGRNLITGVIPKSIGKLERLQILDLESNMLLGTLPFSIGNLTQMVYLYLGSNGFIGPIPPSIGMLKSIGILKSLVVLSLHDNNLNDNLPKELFTLANILKLSLSFNSFNGPIPSEIDSLKFLIKLSLYDNRLFGEIPSSISGCIELEELDFSSNLIQGTIPSSMSNLKGLIVLDLSENNLTGKNPKGLGTLRSLQYLNFSFNHLFGEVPKEGIFLNATLTSLQGNFGLCGGIPGLHLLACPNITLYNKKRKPLLSILLPGMASFLLVLFFILFFIRKKTHFNMNPFKPQIMEDIYPKVSYAKLVRATNAFSSTNLLGIGQYGLVYKGSLDNYGYKIVAVKVFNLQRRGSSRAFTVECEALRRIRHRNLVKIITCCVGIDSKGDDFMAIVFEFMSNGNLDTWLYAHENRMQHLDFIKRLDISINIADALCYLHHECETPIIHCDLKPSNVLIDGNMVAHVGDFGLARLLHGGVSNSLNESHQSSLVIKGTLGYIAPEYGVGSQVSTMGDVYSYGILLLELFTGKRPTDNIFKDGLNLHNFIEMITPDRFMEIIDPNLLLQFLNEDEDDVRSRMSTYECFISILQLSLSCSKASPRERMSMANVAVELHSIRDAYSNV